MVSKTTGDPEGYADYNKHPELYRTDYIIETEDDLRQCMRKNVTEFPPPEDGPAVVGADEKAGGREGSPETGVGGLRPVGSADKGGAAEERRLGTEVDSRL